MEKLKDETYKVYKIYFKKIFNGVLSRIENDENNLNVIGNNKKNTFDLVKHLITKNKFNVK